MAEISRFSTVILSRSGAVAHVILNRPRYLNAYSVAMRDDLEEVFSALQDDPEVRVVILRGAGRAFCSGADLS